MFQIVNMNTEIICHEFNVVDNINVIWFEIKL